MKTIQINDTTLCVPESWNDVTLFHYQKFFNLPLNTVDERIAYVAAIARCTADELKEWPSTVFDEIYNTIAFINAKTDLSPSNSIVIDGVKFVIVSENVLSLGEWIDAENAQSKADLAQLLAILCRPENEKYNAANVANRTELFGNLTVNTISPLLAFFLTYSQILEDVTAARSRAADTLAQFVKSTAILPGVMAGIKLFRIWPAIRFLILMPLLRYRALRCLRS